MDKKTFKQKLADQFLTLLQSDNNFVWKCGWVRDPSRNGVTNRIYSGVNAFSLGLTAVANGYTSNKWFTKNQIFNRRKGKFVEDLYHAGKWSFKPTPDGKPQHGSAVEYWKPKSRKEKRYLTWEEYGHLTEEEKEQMEIYLSSFYTFVWNADQLDGVPEEAEDAPGKDVEISNYVESIRSGMGVGLKHEGRDAFYVKGRDTITLPPPEKFYNSYEYNSTLLHELAHATGHEKRLGRHSLKHYALERPREELVAEITSTFLSVELRPSQEQIDSHKGYVQDWVRQIKDEPDVLYKAVKQAEKAANYMEQYLPEAETLSCAV